MIAASRATVAATATAIVTAGTSGARVTLHVPTGGATVYVGPSDVATTTGLRIVAATTLSLTLPPAATLYGIVASSTQAVDVLVLED